MWDQGHELFRDQGETLQPYRGRWFSLVNGSDQRDSRADLRASRIEVFRAGSCAPALAAFDADNRDDEDEDDEDDFLDEEDDEEEGLGLEKDDEDEFDEDDEDDEDEGLDEL